MRFRLLMMVNTYIRTSAKEGGHGCGRPRNDDKATDCGFRLPGRRLTLDLLVISTSTHPQALKLEVVAILVLTTKQPAGSCRSCRMYFATNREKACHISILSTNLLPDHGT